MLRCRWSRPSQMPPPVRLTARARAQSSMIAPRMLAIPPMRWRALGRIRIQPPAAAAVLRLRRATQAGRIEHEEEKDEGRDQQRFGQRAAAQLDHQRNKIEVFCFGARHQFGDVIGPVDDVGVGEEQIIRCERRRVFQTFGDGPEFSGPTGGKRTGLESRQRRACAATSAVRSEL